MTTAPVAAMRRPTRSPSEIGPAKFLAFFVALLFFLPARLVIVGTGAIGAPATLVGIIAFGWWLAATVLCQREFVGHNAIRTAIFCYFAFVFISWTNGKLRPLTPLEASTSDRAILAMFGLVGIALIAMDGLRTIEEVEHVVRWIMRGAMVMVYVGLIQFFVDYDVTTAVKIPGLQENQASEITSRSDFNRPHGTALHPIEFGVVAAALLPLAYWYARRRRTRGSYIVMASLAFGAMTSLSRSAVLAAAVGALVIFAVVTWQERLTLLVAAMILVIVAGVMVNGLVGTLRSLFTSADTDPSVQARVDRVPRVLALLSEHPWLGRGFGTYTPDDYFLLDNEIQKTVIESGMIGVAVLVVFIGFVAALAWRSRVGDESERLLCAALIAMILGLFLSSYTFDAFFYRILTGLLYLCIGLVGAIYRLTAAERARADGVPVPEHDAVAAVGSPPAMSS